jgi:hypothetical protein
MIATGPLPGPRWAARLGWLAFAAVALWLVWGWKYDPLPKTIELQVVQEPAELAELAPGQSFAFEGRLESLEATPPHWKGRVVWMRTERCRHGGTEWITRLQEDHRPSIAVVMPEGRWILPSQSYDLRLAPKIPDDPWYDWRQGNRGFKSGDSVVARGHIDDTGAPVVYQLAAGPLAHHARTTPGGGAARFVMVNFVRLTLSLLLVVLIWSALMRTRTTRILLRLLTEEDDQRVRRGP